MRRTSRQGMSDPLLLMLRPVSTSAAAADVDTGLSISNSGSDMPCRLVLRIAAVGVAVARRDVAAAVAAAARLEQIQTLAGDLPPLLARWCAVAYADARLTAGEPAA